MRLATTRSGLALLVGATAAGVVALAAVDVAARLLAAPAAARLDFADQAAA